MSYHNMKCNSFILYECTLIESKKKGPHVIDYLQWWQILLIFWLHF